MARPAYFVSGTKKVSELLRELQTEHLQVAVVVDEYGGTAGIISIEDIIEDIVGDISDEHEDEEASVVELGDERYLVTGLLRVEDLEKKLDADLSSGDYETVAGLIFTSLGRIPAVGAKVRKNGWLFDVERADRRRIYRVRVSRDPEYGREEEES
jgi:CBS domain containing-hemolysin-like protein